MAAVKREIYGEWNPDQGQETYQSLAELRSLALTRLTAAVVSSIQGQVMYFNIDSTSFPGQSYRIQQFTSTFSCL